ncbi:MAG: cell division/cell wall cluster transcriptional repressor MraZ [Alphaproteobacteria bacterium]|nr:cell division/cell wall cluster transcriptional repressor MraZ [Alphaproteobacteria bacterium]
MALFLSTYVNKVDRKGRVSVPAAWRAVLTADSPKGENFQGIVAYSSFVHSCIEACGLARIQLLSDSIDALDPFSDERDAFATAILGGSQQLPFDPEGRVGLPQELMEAACITEQAAFVGKGATFEIWEPKAYAEYAAKAREAAKAKRGALRLAGKGDAT